MRGGKRDFAVLKLGSDTSDGKFDDLMKAEFH